MKQVEENNIQWLVRTYGAYLEKGTYIVGVDEHTEFGGADLVIYDVDVLDGISSREELSVWCDENGGDEETFEVDRVCLIKNKR